MNFGIRPFRRHHRDMPAGRSVQPSQLYLTTPPAAEPENFRIFADVMSVRLRAAACVFMRLHATVRYGLLRTSGR